MAVISDISCFLSTLANKTHLPTDNVSLAPSLCSTNTVLKSFLSSVGNQGHRKP